MTTKDSTPHDGFDLYNDMRKPEDSLTVDETCGITFNEPIPVGDFTLRAGKGYNGAPGGDIRLELADGTTVMSFSHDGTVTVRGEKVDNNPAVYGVFRKWLEHATGLPNGANHTTIVLGDGQGGDYKEGP
jgi:hypothetical protein